MSRRHAPVDHRLKERCPRSLLLQANVQRFCWQQLSSRRCLTTRLNIPHKPTRSEGAKAPLPTLP